MEGASRTFGTGPVMTLGGRSLSVNSKLLRCYAEIEAEIINRRGNPFDLARQAAAAFADTPETALLVVQRAFEEAKSWRFVAISEIWRWIDETWAGRCFSVWLAVRDNDPQTLTFDEVSRMYSDEYEDRFRKGGFEAAEEWADSIVRKIIQADGEDELGNSNTSPASGGPEKTETTATPTEGESTGTTSSGS